MSERTPKQEAAFTRMVHGLCEQYSILECMDIMGYYRIYQDLDGLTELAAIQRVCDKFLDAHPDNPPESQPW